MGVKILTLMIEGDKPKPFPKLMINRSTGAIILAISKTHGTVLKQGNGSHSHPIGWRVTYSGLFVDYNEPITLKNE